ncbi:P22AR C-terminal domain-containing protein [Glaesserella parasuis]|nr:P22AR C-terminal domain-containing protein [Glaesserella parasuis]MDO9852053.1 P22AR C-terminal domain-containing protein [Glaesserella parasuis]MDO9864751.1 P22AR C-terminal domain-containing protein [Glaesserella parasuis]MDO9883289.1 P22AR C-terminal domain-containing protein [Glaesserella parasuis]MDO9884767.1 P22AR C-terminal domain-containing protein [Glaesserella parasuis]
MSNLTILKTSIGQLDNLFNLKDLHRVSGNEAKHEPYRFVRLDTTKELIEEIQKEDPTTQPLKTLRGTQGGTYACEELALAYAMWISPKFHLVVLRAFLAMHKQQNQQPKQIALPEPEKKYTFEFTEYELEQLTWLSFSHKQMNDLLGLLIQPLEALGSRYSASVYSHHHEYKRHYTESLDTIKRLTEPFKKSDRLNWKRVIHRLTA